MHLRLNALSLDPRGVRKEIAGYLAREASADSDIAAAELIVGELLSNALRYAPGPLELKVNWRDGFARLVVEDSGPGFEYPSRVKGDPRAESGRGLRLIESLAHHVRVLHEPGVGTTVEVVLPVRRRA